MYTITCLELAGNSQYCNNKLQQVKPVHKGMGSTLVGANVFKLLQKVGANVLELLQKLNLDVQMRHSSDTREVPVGPSQIHH